MTSSDIRELETVAAWLDAYPVVRQLRPHLDEETYLEYLHEMTTDGYRLFAAVEEGTVVAVAGVAVEVNMYYGRHLWVYELVTDAAHRSQGYGRDLLSAVEDWARDRDCERIALSSGLQRTAAHRFYEDRAGMERSSYVYTRSLE